MFTQFKKLQIISIGVLLAGFIGAIAWFLMDNWAIKIPIFGFHNIIEDRVEKESYLDYRTQDLEQVLTHLVAENYWFLDTNELHRYFLTDSQPIPESHLGQKPIMLTFDDGLKSMYEYLLPLLEKLEAKSGQKVKVVLFLNPKSVNAAENGKSSKYMNCQNINEGFQKGYFDIQAHGFSHKKLTELDEKELIDELSDGKDILKGCLIGSRNTETVAAHFAYPYNEVNRKVRDYTTKYYLSGYLYNNEMLRLGWWSDPYRVSRLNAFRGDSPEKLIRLAAHGSELS
ncbi:MULTISPECIES: polysaccharide deacetylase family protein [unclassified Coleofasciculus]|uniref:polysaccharide deacetylase family protein n=1 Tax=unclassified Coleofasciculus TaxID=2692782 RepID=UPI0018824B70|nr:MULTISPECIES: polysaccharide deacetylase family protein [unclassified Coleofasciculus]MBE9125273.1 polysaccharide deacetylase family protein [Coleofasciculus sp. LEGE 07081]MBE9147054.1 polysaccharide deacetylase family protein [Coleofasciculus sp. LEGE 07092]